MYNTDDVAQELTITSLQPLSAEKTKEICAELTDFLFHKCIIPRGAFIVLGKPCEKIIDYKSAEAASEKIFDTLAEFSAKNGVDFSVEYFRAEDYFDFEDYIQFGERKDFAEIIIGGKRTQQR